MAPSTQGTRGGRTDWVTGELRGNGAATFALHRSSIGNLPFIGQRFLHGAAPIDWLAIPVMGSSDAGLDRHRMSDEGHEQRINR